MSIDVLLRLQLHFIGNTLNNIGSYLFLLIVIHANLKMLNSVVGYFHDCERTNIIVPGLQMIFRPCIVVIFKDSSASYSAFFSNLRPYIRFLFLHITISLK